MQPEGPVRFKPGKWIFRLPARPPQDSFQSYSNLYTVSQAQYFCLHLYLVAVLCDTARCLRGDVLWDRHCLHGLERRRVRSGEAAAHALVDWTVPGENTVLSQRALLTAHWRKTTQVLQAESKGY